MNHLFCWLALLFAVICYVQRCVGNHYWATVPVVVLIWFIVVGTTLFGAVFILAEYIFPFFERINWITIQN